MVGDDVSVCLTHRRPKKAAFGRAGAKSKVKVKIRKQFLVDVLEKRNAYTDATLT